MLSNIIKVKLVDIGDREK